ncbi:MAG TPA: indole-3-glycerol phosphate synthase TrpC [Gemmataceae bacterium]|nr:indole-3-glycerol phosphate synthase TrpC [Gemmataceae bacterium]
MTILDTIVQHKWTEIAAARAVVSEIDLERRAAAQPPARDFTAALLRPGIRIIAEIKKASPSAGVIRADFDPAAIAQAYEGGGADCLSVLTDERFFQGHLSFMSAARDATHLPVLRKEFILDRYQLVEARAHGADAVLLIAEILPGDRLKHLYNQALALGLHVLVEVHDAEQLPRAIDCGATLIGINNRDLHAFRTSLDHTFELMARVPAGRSVISESGIKTNLDVRKLQEAGVKGILVGESLMRSADIRAALIDLRGANG